MNKLRQEKNIIYYIGKASKNKYVIECFDVKNKVLDTVAWFNDKGKTSFNNDTLIKFDKKLVETFINNLLLL